MAVDSREGLADYCSATRNIWSDVRCRSAGRHEASFDHLVGPSE
jgi:hypothetical protein